MKKNIPLLIFAFALQSCENISRKKAEENPFQKTEVLSKKTSNRKTIQDTISISKKHNPNTISCDLDGDHLTDKVQIVQNTKNKKYGLEIIFGNNTVEHLAMGKDFLGQGFDDLDWVSIFKIANKGEIYWNNVDENGDIIDEENVKKSDKIKLHNDGIFMHQEESCGGGILYFNNEKFEWIQQE